MNIVYQVSQYLDHKHMDIVYQIRQYLDPLHMGVVYNVSQLSSVWIPSAWTFSTR
jgi:hypothetical protein